MLALTSTCRALVPRAPTRVRPSCCTLARRRGLKTGLVGMPNVGKSSLFNALTGTVDSAMVANYPFATIDPNSGVAKVQDDRLFALADAVGSRKTLPAVLEFFDIAGLVEGASNGEGLGNKFLGNIRECDAIIHVVRCFDDDDIIHVESNVDPLRDVSIINIELALADLEQVERRRNRVVKTARSGNLEAREELKTLDLLLEALGHGKAARHAGLEYEQRQLIKGLHLLTMKPTIYAANVDDSSLGDGNPYSIALENFVRSEGDVESTVINVSAQFESEIIELDAEERADYLSLCGIKRDDEYGLTQLTKAAYSALGLHTFFTAGPQETRAWTIPIGARAPEAAGKIHTDIRDGFIRADRVTVEQMVEQKTWEMLKATGSVRSEGKEYVVMDGDVLLFHHQ